MSNKCGAVLAVAAFSVLMLASSFASADSVGGLGTGTYTYSGSMGVVVGEPASGYTVTGGTIAEYPTAINGNPVGSTTVTITGTAVGTDLFDIGSGYVIIANPTGTNTVTVGTNTFTLPNYQFITAAGTNGTSQVVSGWNALPEAIVAGSISGTLGVSSSFVKSGTMSSLVGVGYVNNSALTTPITTFGSATGVSTNSLLIAPAYKGDFNLSGTVTLAGYQAWQNGYGDVLTSTPIDPSQLWQLGDYLDVGTITFGDYQAWQNSYGAAINSQLPALPTGVAKSSAAFVRVAAVPEPNTFLLLGAAAAMYVFARWRRRR